MFLHHVPLVGLWGFPTNALYPGLCCVSVVPQGPLPPWQLPVHHQCPTVSQGLSRVLVQASTLPQAVVDACGKHSRQHRVLAVQFLWVLCTPC